MVRVDRQDGDDDLDLVAQTLLEGGAQRAVDEAAGEDGVRARTTLTTEEASGDAAGGVHPLLDVHRQGEEVEVVLGVLARGRRGQEHRLAVEVGAHGAPGLLGEASGLEPDGAGTEGAVVDGRFGGGDLRTLHRVLLFSLRPGCIVVVPRWCHLC